MKINTHIVAALVALGFASQALALDPVVYLTGSTAFRSTVFKVLSDNTGSTNSIWKVGTLTYGTWGNSSAGSATYMLFHGTLAANNHPVYLDCAWSGSEAGIASACGATLTNVLRDGVSTNLNGSPETWVDYTTATGLSATGNGTPSGNPGPNGSPANGAQLEASSHAADLAQADTSQAISFTPSVPSVVATQLKPYGAEGVVTFVISRNVQPNPTADWLDTTNVTLPQLNTLFANGSCQAWFLNGQPNDLMYCYLVGRNFGSGTRMNMLGDSQYGAHHSVIQNSIGYGVDPRDPSQSPTTLILKNEGNNGYESGGGVAKALADSGGSNASGSCQQADPIHVGSTGWFALGYLSPSDATSTGNNGGQPTPLIPGPANWVTVDGFASNNNNIENGQWWLWGNENLYGKNGISGDQDATGNALETAVQNSLLSQNLGVTPTGNDAGIPYSLMFVHKSSDTAFPSF